MTYLLLLGGIAVGRSRLALLSGRFFLRGRLLLCFLGSLNNVESGKVTHFLLQLGVTSSLFGELTLLLRKLARKLGNLLLLLAKYTC